MGIVVFVEAHWDDVVVWEEFWTTIFHTSNDFSIWADQFIFGFWIFGIRPEDVNTEAAFLETFPESVVKATISVSELLGSESHLYCQVGDNEFIAKVDARDYLGTGETIELD